MTLKFYLQLEFNLLWRNTQVLMCNVNVSENGLNIDVVGRFWNVSKEKCLSGAAVMLWILLWCSLMGPWGWRITRNHEYIHRWPLATQYLLGCIWFLTNTVKQRNLSIKTTQGTRKSRPPRTINWSAILVRLACGTIQRGITCGGIVLFESLVPTLEQSKLLLPSNDGQFVRRDKPQYHNSDDTLCPNQRVNMEAAWK